jgi:hypothetical protein
MENPTKYSDTIIHLTGFLFARFIPRGDCQTFSWKCILEILIESSECVNVLTVEALERMLFENFVAAVIQIYNPHALEDTLDQQSVQSAS